MTQSPYPTNPAGEATLGAPTAVYPPPPASPYAAYPTIDYQQTPMVVRTNTLSVVTLITAILGVVGLPVILGHLSLNTIKRTGERGYAFAVIGLVLGYLQLVVVGAMVWLAFIGALD
jgi:peptidyl-prolyl cis-trans isomerase B (cyclophilin B)